MDAQNTRKHILILRHGKSQHGVEFGTDFERPLAPRGEKAAKRMAKLIAGEDLSPGMVLTSPAKRALDTALIVSEQLGVETTEQLSEIYGGYADDITWRLRELAEGLDKVLIVGHNPTLEELVSILTGQGGTVLKTCSLAHLSFNGPWEDIRLSGCTLENVWHPREQD